MSAAEFSSPASVLILGASIRAAAASARRAGLAPWGADLFADRDTQLLAPCQRVGVTQYPQAFAALSRDGPTGPWLYTGALENHPALVRRIARHRPTWGNEPAILARVRSPRMVADKLRVAGLAVPAINEDPPADLSGRWLLKRRKSASGAGILRWTGQLPPDYRPGQYYFQEWVEGDAFAALYIGTARQACLVGVTRQLIGEPWLHAGAFRYCGSVGPIPLQTATRQALERLGNLLVEGIGVRGVFGVDFILRDDTPWPVEINPRYTASVEVLELACGIPILDWHRQAFESSLELPTSVEPTSGSIVGKGILFCKIPGAFPSRGPWDRELELPQSCWQLPRFADIPNSHEPLQPGWPILSLFAQGKSLAECMECLQARAQETDALFSR